MKPLIQPTGKTLLILLAIALVILAIALAQIFSLPNPSWELLAPLLVSTFLCAALGLFVVPVLRRLKASQIIQEDGPQSHLKKAGTPTMGGIFFVPTAVLLAIIWSGFAPLVMGVAGVTLSYALIGFYDDWQILNRRSNKGISPRMKLSLQVVIAVAFGLWLFWSQPAEITTVSLPGGLQLPLGILFWPLVGFVLAAESNATNLTDGVDGLAGGTVAIAFIGLAAIVAGDQPELGLFCACLSGGCLGFVVHNRNKADVFMGDTGSLALGGALAAVGLLSNHLWALFIISGIFFVESLSVIAQVSYYKATKGPDGKGKRLLKMAPFHHHLELSGWSETQIVGAFYLVNVGLVLLAIAIRT